MREITLLSPSPGGVIWALAHQYPHLWGRDGSHLSSYLCQREGGGKGLLWFLCLHPKSRGCLDVGQTGDLLVQSEENKERWKMEGWKEEEQRREEKLNRRKKSVFK